MVSQVTVGSFVSVYWPLDDTYYQAKVVGASTAATSTSSSSEDSIFTVAYTDGSVETLNLRQEKFRLLGDGTEFVKEQQERASSPDAEHAATRKVAACSATATVDAKHNQPIQQIGSRYDANVPKFSASSSELSDDVYVLILSCLTSLKDISALSRTCRRTYSLWRNGMHRDRLLHSLFRSQFGSNANACTFGGVLGPVNNNWQGIWRTMVDLKQALVLQESPSFANLGFNKRTKEQMCQLLRTFTGAGDGNESDGNETEEEKKLPASTSARTVVGIKRKRSLADRLRRTVGILSDEEEAEAIFYDNPSFAPESEQRYCFGYFGMVSLNISMPDQAVASGVANESSGPPVAVWGDFPGCRIFHSATDVLYDLDTSPTSSRRGKIGEEPVHRFESIADRDGEGLVLSALVCPFADELQTIDVEGNALRPVLFLGMSSGMVISIGIGAGTDGNRATYGVLGSEEAHESEVTSLVVVKNPVKTGSVDSPKSFMLASGSVDKNIKVYPLVFSAESNYSLGQNCTVCLSESLMFCLAGTTVQQMLTLIAAGDEKGFISFYASEIDVTKDPGFSFYSAGKSKFSQREQIKPTRMKFLDHDVLLAGSTHGDVKIMQLRVREDLNRSQVSVVTLHRMSSAHVGTIEQMERFGDVLITSGGFDGQMKGWNFRTGRLLGNVVCHPGRHSAPETASVQPNRPIFSSVVGSVLCDDITDGKSLLCLCRDGTLFRWKFTQNLQKYEASRTDTSNGVDSNDWLESLLRPAAKSAKAAGIKRQRKIFTLADLKHVMTKTGRVSQALQQRMRLAIFKSAVAVALQPDHKDTPFLGADGKVYESTKKAFSKYSGLQACASCRSRSQGVRRLGYVCVAKTWYQLYNCTDSPPLMLTRLFFVFI